MIRFSYREDINAVHYTVEGEFTLDAYLDATKQFMESDFFTPGLNSLWEFHSITIYNLPADNIKSIAHYLKTIAPRRGENWKTALVVDDDVALGLANTFQIYSKIAPITVKIFRDISEAEIWLQS